MSIMQKQRSRDPRAGYATDFVTTVERVLAHCIERNIKIVANAGGVNPDACRDAIATVVKRLGLEGKVRIGVVSGDDLMGSLDDLISAGITLKNMNFTNAATVDFPAAPTGLSLGNNTADNAAIHLQNASNVVLDNLAINGSAEQGINGHNVNGFTLK